MCPTIRSINLINSSVLYKSNTICGKESENPQTLWHGPNIFRTRFPFNLMKPKWQYVSLTKGANKFTQNIFHLKISHSFPEKGSLLQKGNVSNFSVVPNLCQIYKLSRCASSYHNSVLSYSQYRNLFKLS